MSVAINPALIPPAAAGAADAPGGPGATGLSAGTASRASGANPAATGPSFASVLDGANRDAARTESLRFSKHALQRVQRRGIDVGPATLARLADGVGRAAGKGSRDSIVLVDGTAFVVSVPSRTVVTAVGSTQMRDHVFTNIDSAVIA